MERILVIDDSRLDARVLADILKEEYEVCIALNGEEGLKKAKEEKPVLILLDIIMPVMDGFVTLEHLKNEDVTKDIPVVFLTALTDEKTEEKGLMKGAVDYIKKPFNPNIVRARVRTHSKMYLYMRTIESQMSIDGLTGIFNRRAFEQQKELWWTQAEKEAASLTYFILDVDYFKLVNDTYGHGEGDFVLKTIAGTMQKCVNDAEGCLARFGGEEFSVLLYNKTEEEAKEVAERIRKEILELHIPNIHSKVCQYLTVSIGGCTVEPDSDKDIDGMFALADNMLYEAKNSGRNCVYWGVSC